MASGNFPLAIFDFCCGFSLDDVGRFYLLLRVFLESSGTFLINFYSIALERLSFPL